MENLKYVTEGTFESDVIQSDIPVLVDFTATWCGPCKMLAPVISELAQDWGGKVNIYKMDVDTSRETPQKYSVMGVPRDSILSPQASLQAVSAKTENPAKLLSVFLAFILMIFSGGSLQISPIIPLSVLIK